MHAKEWAKHGPEPGGAERCGRQGTALWCESSEMSRGELARHVVSCGRQEAQVVGGNEAVARAAQNIRCAEVLLSAGHDSAACFRGRHEEIRGVATNRQSPIHTGQAATVATVSISIGVPGHNCCCEVWVFRFLSLWHKRGLTARLYAAWWDAATLLHKH